MAQNSNFFPIDFGLAIVNKYLWNYKIQLEPKGFYIEKLNCLVMTILPLRLSKKLRIWYYYMSNLVDF